MLDLFGMYARLVKRPNNRVSIRIVESNRVGCKVQQKIVCGVGTAHAEDEARISSLMRVAEQLIIRLKNEIRPTLPGFENEVHASTKKRSVARSENQISISTIREERRIHKGIDDVFGQMFEQLSLFDSLSSGYKQEESNNLFKEVVLGRISSPVSKRKSVEKLKRDKHLSVELNKVYRMMDKVHDNIDRIKDKVRNVTFGLFKQKVDVAFFDVTTLYFESFVPDTLRASGYSKDNKFKETQVMLALITTTGGLPIGYELFPGNHYEGKTLLKVIESIEASYDLSETFIVADRAMFTKENLSSLKKKNTKFIVAAKLKTMKKDLREQIITDVSQTLKENEELENWTKDYDLDGNRLIISYSRKRANKDRKDRERLVERISKKMKNGKIELSSLINNTGTKKFLLIEKGKQQATLDQNKIDRLKRWDGIHGVITNHTQRDLTSDAILQRYRGLWQIEDAFRINKHDLKMRPIYHWTPRRIKAHIAICFVAYALVAFVKYKLKQKNISISIPKLREELNYLQASIVVDTKTKQRFLLPSNITEVQRQIYSALNLKHQTTPVIL